MSKKDHFTCLPNIGLEEVEVTTSGSLYFFCVLRYLFEQTIVKGLRFTGYLAGSGAKRINNFVTLKDTKN